MTLGIWIARGLTLGVILGLLESLLAAFSGRKLPLLYLLSVVGVDAMVGAAIGLTIFLLYRVFKVRSPADPALALPALCAGAAVFLFAQMAAIFFGVRGLPGFLGIVALGVTLAALVPLGTRLLSLGKATNHEPALAMALVAVVSFLVGGHYFTRRVFVSYLSAGAVLFNLAISLALVGVVFGLNRISRHRSKESPSAATVTFFTSAIALVVILASWFSLSLNQAEISIPAKGVANDQERPSVILITVDTLRADHTSVYGYERRTTPHLERFAEHSVTYGRAVSPSSWTLPAHASVFTGTFPRTHGAHYLQPEGEGADGLLAPPWGGPLGAPLDDANLTLAEILSDHGYATAAVVANSAYLHRAFNLDQGFAFYDDRVHRVFDYEPVVHGLLRYFPLTYNRLIKSYPLAAEVNEVAFQWLERNHQNPFFLFLNYMDPHGPYSPPSPFEDAFPDRLRVLDPLRASVRHQEVDEDVIKHYVSLYDGEVAYTDQALGVLFDKLRELKIFDKSLVIVTSDHGEFFGEHGMWEHGFGPYEDVHRVPLIVKYPSSTRVGVDNVLVQTVDILPTVLETLGIAIPAAVQGHSLDGMEHPVMTEQYLNTYFVASFGDRFNRGYRSWYRFPWKFVLYSDGSDALFRLDEDPGEEHDVSSAEPTVAASLKRDLEEFVSSIEPFVSRPRGRQQPNEDVLKRLRALGYVQ